MCHHMVRFLALFAWLALIPGAAFAAPGLGNERPVLIELFASQNCPACPKAHRTLKSVTEDNDDVLVLTWSVDYWDYLGDADPMAMPEAKARQAAYTERMNLRAPYTPQSVYDGAIQCPATRRKRVDRHIAERRRDAGSADAPSLTQDGSAVRISGTTAAALEVMLIEYLPPEAHDTGMVNPVIAARSLGLWTGQDVSYATVCGQSCAVLLQQPDYGEIIAALALN